MNNKVIDGVRVFDGYVQFDEWLEVNGYESKSQIKENVLFEDGSEDEAQEEIDNLYDDFCEWADENDLTPQYAQKEVIKMMLMAFQMMLCWKS